MAEGGVIENGRLYRTEEGTPQGGVVSPVLLNVALHGMEQAAGVRYHTTGRAAGWTIANSPVLIRYADDMVALCHSRDEALEIKARLAEWLAPRGLCFNEDKTRVVCLDDGFDFLGFNVRRYRGKLLIKPSTAAQRRIRERLRTEMRSLRGANAGAVIKRLNPIIRGWAAYYRGVVSSETFHALDRHLWTLAFKWAVFNHSNKPRHWVVNQYFGQFNKSRRDRWVFGDRDSGAYLNKFAWTRIYRHQMVRGTASLDDHALTDYWAERRRKAPLLPIGNTSLRLYEAQHGRCPLCRGRYCPTRTCHKAHASGNTGRPPPARRSPRSQCEMTARRIRPNPVSYTTAATNGTPPLIAELYPEVVDACEEEGGVPSRLTKTEAGDGRQEGTPCQMFAGSPPGRTTRVGSRSMISRGRERVG